MTVVFADANKIKCRARAAVSRGTTKCVQTCSFLPSAAYAVGTPNGRALRAVYRNRFVGRDDPARRVQASSIEPVGAAFRRPCAGS